MPATVKRDISGTYRRFYPTPDWATRALIEREKFVGNIWEPACGVDFLATFRDIDNVVTNPPFNIAEDFIHHALHVSRRKVCMFLRLAFLEGKGRHLRLYGLTPPTRVYVFSERVTFSKDGVHNKSGEAMSFAWYVWDKDVNQPYTVLRRFPPGTKDRLS